ncbi:bestrophin family ion channel [Cyclobacterium plantarum]|uniref:bestrophin family ion channel n=1 Tax=Cyclobacterium plantarum TaxID=2716263 RepID=UPI003F6EF092
MIVRRNLKLSSILFYTWRELLYYLLLSSSIYILHYKFQVLFFDIPSYTIAPLGTALAIFLGFKNNNVYSPIYRLFRL